MTATLNFATAPGHQILAAAGKKTLRPGGRKATEQLFTWANFQPGETVLELAASFGESAISLAKRFDVCVVWKILTNTPLRQRVWQMRRSFQKYQQDLGYIVFISH
jgi:hypothetical protein